MIFPSLEELIELNKGSSAAGLRQLSSASESRLIELVMFKGDEDV